MKTQGECNKLEMGGVTGTSHTFTIQATAKAFKILSDGLYSDKVTAVIRELSCNAYDAHVANGNQEKPFEVHLPNNFEPFFKVGDFGPGLEEKDIYDLYTSYFQYTKMQSNEYIGALGLGSKSPFSYTDSFTVTSYFAGVKKVYSAYLTEEGMPTIVKMGEEESAGERTGLEVQFPVKQHDFYDFSYKAMVALRYFPVIPKITGKAISISQPKYVLKGDGWAIRAEGGNARAVQGVVAYTVPAISGRHEHLSALLNGSGVDLFFPIGELEVAASRETLSMNKITTANIITKLEKVKAEMMAEIKKEIDACPTKWEAMKKLYHFKHNGPLYQIVRNTNFNWNSAPLTDFLTIKQADYPAIKFTTLQISGHRRTISEDDRYDHFTVIPDEDIMIIQDVETRGSRSLYRKYFKDCTLCNTPPRYIVSFKKMGGAAIDGTPTHSVEAYEAAVAKFLEVLGGATIKPSSDIRALIPKKEKIAGTKVNRETFTTLRTSNSEWRYAWMPATDEALDADTKYYIPTLRNKPLNEDSGYTTDFLNVVASLKRLGLIEEDALIFSGSPAMQKAIAKDEENLDSWVNINKIVDKFYAMMTPTLLDKLSCANVSFSNLNLPNMNKSMLDMPLFQSYKEHPFIQFCEKVRIMVHESDAVKTQFQDVCRINQYFRGISLSMDGTLTKLQNEKNRFDKKYPLASFNTWRADYAELLSMVRYMTAMDLLEEKENEATAKAV